MLQLHCVTAPKILLRLPKGWSSTGFFCSSRLRLSRQLDAGRARMRAAAANRSNTAETDPNQTAADTTDEEEIPEPKEGDEDAAEFALEIVDEGDLDDWVEDEDDTDLGTIVDTGDVAWGKTGLAVARKMLEGHRIPGVQLYSFRALARNKRLDIRLDKLDDLYGSPSLDEIETFARDFNTELESVMGEEAAGEIEVEVSSPGAERAIQVPRDLERFKELPMKVAYSLEGDSRVQSKLLKFDKTDEAAGLTVWRLANVRENRRGGKGTRLSKKAAEEQHKIPITALQRVNLYIDV